MAGIKQGMQWFAGPTLAVCVLAAVDRLSRPPGDPGDRVARPVVDAVDAAGLLYREMPVNLVGEVGSRWCNVAGAGIFLTTNAMSQQELDLIPKALPPDSPKWRGVLYVKARGDRHFHLNNDELCGGRVLDYRTFIICGDPVLTRRARQVLAAARVRPLNDPDEGGDEL
jgi:hypothetical protein